MSCDENLPNLDNLELSFMDKYGNDIAPQSYEDQQQIFYEALQTIPQNFMFTMMEGLPPETKIHVGFRGSVLRSIHCTYKGDEGVFEYSHGFGNNSAFHYGAECQGAVRERDINKKLQGRFFSLYQNLGIEKVELGAMDVGCYAWPRLGFVPYERNWKTLSHWMLGRLKFIEENSCPKNGPLSDTYVQGLRRILQDPDPKSLWAIVDQAGEYYGAKLGYLLTCAWDAKTVGRHFPMNALDVHDDKKFLAEQHDWSGSFDMRDYDGLSRLKSYLGPEGRGIDLNLAKKIHIVLRAKKTKPDTTL